MDEVDPNQKRRGLLEYTLHPTSPMISLRIPRRRYLALPTAGEPPDERLNRNPGAGRLEESTGRRPWTLPDFLGGPQPAGDAASRLQPKELTNVGTQQLLR